MQQPAKTAPSKSIPQHIAERLESEWQQVRDTASREPGQR